jgi:hypothetical protein
MRLDSALSKSRLQYISAQKISTLFDALDEREIVEIINMADFQAKICEKFNINSLTDNQSKSIMANMKPARP